MSLAPLPSVVWMPGGVRTEIHLGAAETGGAMCLVVDHPPEGWSLPRHRHRDEAETIHVIAGHFVMTVGDEERLLGPGDTLHIPPGVPHDGRLLGGVGHRLITFTPGGMERFFLEAGSRHPSSSTNLAHALAAATANGWEFIDSSDRRAAP